MALAYTGFHHSHYTFITIQFILSKRVTKNFDEMILVLRKFEAGDYTARFNENQRNELQPLLMHLIKWPTFYQQTFKSHYIRTGEKELYGKYFPRFANTTVYRKRLCRNLDDKKRK